MVISWGNGSSRKKTGPIPPFPPKTTHELTWDLTRTSVVRNQRVTARPAVRYLYAEGCDVLVLADFTAILKTEDWHGMPATGLTLTNN
jgi:hypothetical protein